MNANTKSLLRRGVESALKGLNLVGLDPARRLKPLSEIGTKIPGVAFEPVLQPEDYHLAEPDYAINFEGSRYLRYLSGVGTYFRSYTAGMAVLPNGRFAFPTGIHGTGGLFPAETNLILNFPPNHAVTQTLNLWLKPATVIDDGVLLSIALSRNYYHWLLEILPRLQLFANDERYTSLPIYVAQDLPKFVRETLAATGIKAERFVELPAGNYTAKTLFVPTTLQRIAWPTPAAYRWLRQTFIGETAPAGTRSQRTRLIVSRRDAAERQLVNEDELIAALKPLGFQTVTLSGKKFTEQISMFRNAEIAIGSHGAGSANMLFAEPDSALIEIVNNVHVGLSGWMISKIAGRKHGYIVGQDHPEGVIVDVNVAVNVVQRALADIESMRHAQLVQQHTTVVPDAGES